MLNKERHRGILINILKDIYNSDIAKYLAFKGGTASYFLHNLDRFSTDLDFDFIGEYVSIDTELRDILNKYGKIKGGKRLILTYGTREYNIKIDISRKEKVWKNNKYEIVNLFGIDIKVQDKSTIFANKLIALTDRKRLANRDLYDIYFFFKENFPINEKVIEERTREEEWKENNINRQEYLTKNEYFEYLIYFLENKIPKGHKILDGLGEVLNDDKHKYFVKTKLIPELILLLKDKIKVNYESNPLFISKSLFVDYKENPKLAWWKQNNLEIYKKIKGIEDNESSENLIELGQKVEDLVGEYFLKKFGLTRLDVFEDNTAKNDLDEEDEDVYLVKESYKEKTYRNIKRTLEAIKNKEELIYQPGFMTGNLFVRGDYLKLNSNGNYDLIEVKAKTGIRKDKIFEGVKNKNIGNLESKFLTDISFQKYVINKVLEKENLGEIENFFFAYLNSNYKKNKVNSEERDATLGYGEINVKKLVILDEVNTKKEILLESEENEKIIEIDDRLLSKGLIEETLNKIKKELVLEEESFNKIHNFSGSKALEYFGKDREFGTIFGKGLTSPKAVKELYYKGKIKLDELDTEEQELFNKSNGEVGSARKYIINYLKAKKEGNYISIEEIKNEFDDIKYPICFYDYESCSVPIPFLDNTSPYQHTVVQYSLHKVYENGKIEHFGGVLSGTGEKEVKQIEIENNPNKVESESEKVITGGYEDLLNEFIKDIGEDLDKTFIVWYKPFENTRNKEIAETFPQLKLQFETINENTYDLMDIFKKGYYYSLKFKGSNSIKYVLPAMVPSMSYDNMAVPNGLEAMQVLNDVINTNKYNSQEKEDQIKNLLLYCGQDSLAMYKIYEEVLKKLD